MGTYPDPESCAYYYQCAPGVFGECIKDHHQCLEYFAFDKDHLQCVLATDADCDGMDSEKKCSICSFPKINNNCNIKQQIFSVLQ